MDKKGLSHNNKRTLDGIYNKDLDINISDRADMEQYAKRFKKSITDLTMKMNATAQTIARFIADGSRTMSDFHRHKEDMERFSGTSEQFFAHIVDLYNEVGRKMDDRMDTLRQSVKDSFDMVARENSEISDEIRERDSYITKNFDLLVSVDKHLRDTKHALEQENEKLHARISACEIAKRDLEAKTTEQIIMRENHVKQIESSTNCLHDQTRVLQTEITRLHEQAQQTAMDHADQMRALQIQFAILKDQVLSEQASIITTINVQKSTCPATEPVASPQQPEIDPPQTVPLTHKDGLISLTQSTIKRLIVSNNMLQHHDIPSTKTKLDQVNSIFIPKDILIDAIRQSDTSFAKLSIKAIDNMLRPLHFFTSSVKRTIFYPLAKGKGVMNTFVIPEHEWNTIK